ncbi:MAG TPA: hypothetical protein VGM56_27485 [Byssovorax sp.]|jgi:hypothetical protein
MKHKPLTASLRGWQVILCLLAAAPAFGCAAESSSDSPDAGETPVATLVSPSALNVSVASHGAPVPNALVIVRALASATEFAPGVLWQAMTDVDGQVNAVLPLRADQIGGQLELVVHRAGWVGPWTDEQARVTAGDFAPSSIQTIAAQDLGGLAVELDRRTP